ncbi:hypothetical protein GCM10009759_50560 [Kitasatospora saccharophila]|uniref:Alpha/beta hydrolase family protein n=1 Tax=Kitasatospora saccharophila TaxID=407973 RepID=A0ABN1K2Q7_9ACTN
MTVDQVKPQLVFVHGIGGSRDPEQELADWKGALAEGAADTHPAAAKFLDKSVSCSFACYADLFATAGAQGGAPGGASAEEIEITRVLMVELLDDVLELPDQSGNPLLRRCRTQLASGEGAQGVLNVVRVVSAAVTALLAVPGANLASRALSRMELLGMLSQPGRYLHRGAPDATGLTLDQRIRDRVHACLDPARPAVVVAHSLGTVVALEALSEYPGRTALFVTLGSPITTRAFVWPLLRPRPPATPETVDDWADFRDGDDPVVPKRRLVKAIRPNGRGVQPVSQRMDSVVFFPHGAERYLRRREVAEPVLRTLTALAAWG